MAKLSNTLTKLVHVFIGIRKLLVVLLFLLLGLWLFSIKEIKGIELFTAIKGVVIVFLGTNIGEHIAKSIAEWGKKK